MAFPSSIRVRISSEAAESISLSPVSRRDFSGRELIGLLLASTGKDAPRIRGILRRGTHAAGLTRFRWEGWDACEEDIASMLALFPDPWPERVFCWGDCELMVLHGERAGIEVPREAGRKRRLLRRDSFWDVAETLAARAAPAYHAYSYKARADCYRLELDGAARAMLRDGARLLAFEHLARRIAAAPLTHLELYLPRSGDERS